MSDEELRKTLGRHIRVVANGEEITVMPYHGTPSVAIVSLAHIPHQEGEQQ